MRLRVRTAMPHKVKLERMSLLFLFLIGLAFVRTGHAKRQVVNIYWNTTNPMFRIDNTDNVIDINRDNLPWEYDQANLICPMYKPGTREADMERYIIYNVSRDEYNNCHIVSPNPRVVAVCNKPGQPMYFTLTFRSFTPTPGGMEFQPGRDYYFISTSSRLDLHRRIGGRCSTHNMKVMFKVAQASEHVGSPGDGQGSRVGTVNVPRAPTRRPASPVLKTSAPPGGDRDEYLYPTSDIDIIHNNAIDNVRPEDVAIRESRQQPSVQEKEAAVKQASVMPSSASSWTRLKCSLLVLLVSVSTTAQLWCPGL